MKKKTLKFLVFQVFIFISQMLFAQTPNYVSLYEIIDKDNRLELREGSHVIDINSQLLIEFDLESMKRKNIQVAISIFAKRGASFLNLPDQALSNVEIFPNIDPQDTTPRNQFIMSGNDEEHKQILLDLRGSNIILKAKGKDIQEYDHIFIKFTEVGGIKSYSTELELVDLGLSFPSEISAPLMAFKTGIKNSPIELGLGVTGVWHYKTRGCLQDYFGFGITITPNNINLDELKNSKLGIIPTISIGLGRKNTDVFLLGAGYYLGVDRPIYFAGLNLAWIGRLIK
jgi:hypothetical protein